MNNFFSENSFLLNQSKKKKYFEVSLSKRINHHYRNCPNYKKILNNLSYNPKKSYKIENFPFLSVRIFKKFDLYSIKKKNIFKILNSSGTSSGELSKIYLDKKNAQDQSIVLTNIFNSFFGKSRYPMLIIDSEDHLKNRNSFSARSAAVLGFSRFGKDITFALDKKMNLKINQINNFFKKYQKENFIIFGFTFMIWEKFYNSIKNKKKYNLKNAILIHGGGWKKLESLNISNSEFKKKIQKNLKISKIHNYYGMIEQTGSIFFECSECENFIASDYSDVLIRGENFEVLDKYKLGYIQLLSTLPSSYPGNNILTEDLGMITENKNCKTCSRMKGKRFKVFGRIKDAELRGCSDV